jgi:hypothetical protein
MAKKRSAKRVQAQIAAPRTCSTGVCDPQRTQGLKAPAPNGNHALTLEGPGLFLGAAVTKQGGTNDLTFVILDIDGRNVTNLSTLPPPRGLTQHNLMACSAALDGAEDGDDRPGAAAGTSANWCCGSRSTSRTSCRSSAT